MKHEVAHVPIERKVVLTIPEAAEYSNIGQNVISTLLKSPGCIELRIPAVIRLVVT